MRASRPDAFGLFHTAKWPSGKARACKALTPGSNPGFASMIFRRPSGRLFRVAGPPSRRRGVRRHRSSGRRGTRPAPPRPSPRRDPPAVAGFPSRAPCAARRLLRRARSLVRDWRELRVWVLKSVPLRVSDAQTGQIRHRNAQLSPIAHRPPRRTQLSPIAHRPRGARNSRRSRTGPRGARNSRLMKAMWRAALPAHRDRGDHGPPLLAAGRRRGLGDAGEAPRALDGLGARSGLRPLASRRHAPLARNDEEQKSACKRSSARVVYLLASRA